MEGRRWQGHWSVVCIAWCVKHGRGEAVIGGKFEITDKNKKMMQVKTLEMA
jgi:hypothetical protein